ncbi:MAG TPA: winged helix-turn-helix domain-containing protein [Aestuariivirga sp.]|nr:winged helix-turn-helix domain-containing protein [Aestuariivirga sp.]
MDQRFGGYLLKRRERQLEGPGGPVELSARSFDILCALLDRPGDVIAKDDIFAIVWPGVVVEENTLQVHVSALRKALDPGFIVTVHGRGYKYAGPAPQAAEAEAPATAPPDSKPVIVVLPFDNLSGDPAQQYFSDGITQDIIDRLSRYRVLSVIGHDSSFLFRGPTPDIDTISQTFGAGFLVSGNIRRSDTRIRISVRLTDATTRKAIWAEHYDRPLADLFEVQDDVADVVAATVAKQLEIEITRRSARQHPASLSAYEQILLGQWHFAKLTRPGNDLALACFERAVAADPSNGTALAWLGLCYQERWFIEFCYDSMRKGTALAAQAVELEPSNAVGYNILSFGQLWTSTIDAARASSDMAVALRPGEPYFCAQRTLVEVLDCRPDVAGQWLAQALRLNPLPPLWFAEYDALIAFQEGRYADAVPGFAAIPDCSWDMMYLIASHGYLGEREKVRAIIDRFAAAGRSYDFIATAAREPYRDPAVRERLVEGLRMALSGTEA